MQTNIFIFVMAVIASITVQSQQNELYQQKEFIKDTDTLNYRILYPNNFSETSQYPVVLFLHGAGERGSDNENQLIHGSTLFANEAVRDSFPAIVIFPQCPADEYWANVDVNRSTYPVKLKFNYENGPTKPMELVIDLMENLVKEPFVKNDQVYIMGLSMGGMGTFELIYRKPEMFAAAIPICGGGDISAVKEYAKTIPVWVFHGAQDNVVDPQLSIDMVEAILKEGGFPKFTIYDFANHNSWDPAFAEPDLLQWLFSHKKTINK